MWGLSLASLRRSPTPDIFDPRYSPTLAWLSVDSWNRDHPGLEFVVTLCLWSLPVSCGALNEESQISADHDLSRTNF